MRTRVEKGAVIYEIVVSDPQGVYTRRTDGDEVVWRRVVPITQKRASMTDRREAGREQDRVSMLMAAAGDPIAAMRRVARRADWSEREKERTVTP